MTIYYHSFFDDYSEGAHPNILAALTRTNMQQELGYGKDSLTLEAERLILQELDQPQAHVHFVTGGTQANLVSLSLLLEPYESVISTDSGHINTYEAGAIEATGHKVIIVPSVNGKLTPELVQTVLDDHKNELKVKPRVVYISQSTEVGTLYSKHEMEQLAKFCHKKNLYFYIDGARLASALMANEASFTLKDIAQLADLFYLGGTKNGALIGEAIVVVNPKLQPDFRRNMRQRGAMLAKGRLIGVQFIELFTNNLYFDNARDANLMAQKLAEGFKAAGHGFFMPVATNQVFPILPKTLIEKLQKKYGFYDWCQTTDPKKSVIRLVTSWATPESAVQQFIADLTLFD